MKGRQTKGFPAMSVARVSRLPQGLDIHIWWSPLPARRRDDLLQGRDMAGEGAAALRGRGHRGLRLLADKGLVDRDVAGPRQRLDMGAEIAVGRAGQLLQPGKFEPAAGRQRVQRGHDPQPQWLMDDIVEFGHRFNPGASRDRRRSARRH